MTQSWALGDFLCIFSAMKNSQSVSQFNTLLPSILWRQWILGGNNKTTCVKWTYASLTWMRFIWACLLEICCTNTFMSCERLQMFARPMPKGPHLCNKWLDTQVDFLPAWLLCCAIVICWMVCGLFCSRYKLHNNLTALYSLQYHCCLIIYYSLKLRF